MKTKLLTISMIALLAITSISYSKNDDEKTTPPNTNPVAGYGFLLRENDPASTTIQTVSSTSFSKQFKTLIAKNSARIAIFEINLSWTTATTYPFGWVAGSTLAYTSPMLDASSVECIVTTNTNGKISVTFKAFISGTGFTRLYGTFTDITVTP